MSDAGAPNDTENMLISNRSIEALQDLVDTQIERQGVVDEWPENWEKCGAVYAWKCYSCGRIYINPKGPSDKVVVYSVESVGI